MGACSSPTSVSQDDATSKKMEFPRERCQVKSEGVFISTEMLNNMMDTFEAGSLLIFDATQKPDADVHKEFCASHVRGARFFDLGLVRD